MQTLIVEDDAPTRRLLEGILGARGHEVTARADAESAWEAYQQTPYRLALLDWVLPGMDGLQLCRLMRAHPHGDRSVIVVATSRDRADDLQAVLDAGADDYITKPFDVGRLTVRLAIAEQHVRHLEERRRAQARVAEVMHEVERSRDDLLSILNQLRVGTAMTSTGGEVTFLSDAARRMLGRTTLEVDGLPWSRLFPVDHTTLHQLQATCSQPAAQRTKVAARFSGAGIRDHWVDIEVRDDPRDPDRKIFFLYDMSEVHDLRRLLGEKAQFHDLVGKSPRMLQTYQLIRDVARVDTTVLIEGETGTGKELVARAIHSLSPRADQPCVTINSAGLTESLLASQLFGHRRGAFTGAVEDHKGFFETADRGTIFLDEIGDVPLPVQASLLRVLQEKEILRLGESTPRRIDVRVLAATHRNLAEEVDRGTFRADLLYRIRVARIALPALRERREDIPLLVGTFLGALSAAANKPVDGVSPDAMRLLLAYEWPGNVRELRSAVEFAVIRCRGGVLLPEDFPPELAMPAHAEGRRRTLLPVDEPEESEAARIRAALQAARGNRTRAAKLLGVSRATFYRRLSELGMAGTDARDTGPAAGAAAGGLTKPRDEDDLPR